MAWSRLRTGVLVVVGSIPLLGLACSASNGASTSGHAAETTSATGTGGHGATTGTGGAAGTGGTGLGGGTFTHGSIVSIAISPPSATLDVSGAPKTQPFHAIATYQDKTTQPVSVVEWSATNLAVGSIASTGVFTANGAQGGTVTLTAAVGKLKATATLSVDLHLVVNPDGVNPASQSALQGASMPDGSVVWAYPYDGMVYPRGIGAPGLMWNGGGPTDTLYIHLVSQSFEAQIFKANLNVRYDFDPTLWEQFTQSTSGAAELTVARLSDGNATLLVDQHYTIAPASMRGTIYYWAINTGRVMRIKPGATAPDDFLGPTVTCPSCHTVSANGSSLVMNEGNWPEELSITYDLGTSANAYSGLDSNNNGASQWALPGVSADGTVLVQNFASLRGPIGQQTGAFDVATGNPLPPTGLEGKQLFMPAFAPDDKLLAYVDPTTGDLRAYDWDATAKQATNDRLIVSAGSNTAISVINAPTVSPDHQWIAYQRSSQNGSLGNAADLYLASVASPGTEILLAQLNGDNYPFAAGARDQQLNFEPTFAPVAAGGYFWVVFHSRRTFGNTLTGPAFVAEGNGVKQLWVAAIDQSPTPGQDPSHPAFWLPGQDLTTLNMRGFWALDPCKADGMGCMSGTECCGGYCDTSGDAGQPVCQSSVSGCSASGDHCKMAADCCDPKAVCINSVCSEPPPN